MNLRDLRVGDLVACVNVTQGISQEFAIVTKIETTQTGALVSWAYFIQRENRFEYATDHWTVEEWRKIMTRIEPETQLLKLHK